MLRDESKPPYKERSWPPCVYCMKDVALLNKDICCSCRANKCLKNELKEHSGDPCKLCGYERVLGAFSKKTVAESHIERIPATERQAQLAAYSMRRALCRGEITESYGGKNDFLEIINEILGVPGVEYKIVKMGP